MPSFAAISSADMAEPRRNALSRLPISSKRIGMVTPRMRENERRKTEDGWWRRPHPDPLEHSYRLSVVMSSVVRRRSSIVRLAHPLRRIERGDDDVVIAGAAAQIAGNADADVFFARIGIFAQQLDQRRQNSRRAEAALQAMIIAERLLQRVQRLAVGRDAFDRHDLVAVGLHREHQARAGRTAVEQNGAGAADAVLAAQMRAGKAQIVPQEI